MLYDTFLYRAPTVPAEAFFDHRSLDEGGGEGGGPSTSITHHSSSIILPSAPCSTVSAVVLTKADALSPMPYAPCSPSHSLSVTSSLSSFTQDRGPSTQHLFFSSLTSHYSLLKFTIRNPKSSHSRFPKFHIFRNLYAKHFSFGTDNAI